MAPCSFFQHKVAAIDHPVLSKKDAPWTQCGDDKRQTQTLPHGTKTESSVSINDQVSNSDNGLDADYVTLSPQLSVMKHCTNDNEQFQDSLRRLRRDQNQSNKILSTLSSESVPNTFQRKRPPRSPSQGSRTTMSFPAGPNNPLPPRPQSPRTNTNVNAAVFKKQSPDWKICESNNSPLPSRVQSPRRGTEFGPSSYKKRDTPLDRDLHKESKGRRRFNSFDLSQSPSAHKTTHYNSPVRNNRQGSHSSRLNLKIDDLGTLTRTMKRRREKYGEHDYRVGRTWNHIGNFFFRNQVYGKALDSYMGAVLCDEGDDAHIGAAYGNIGTVYWTRGDLGNASAFLHKALDMYRYRESRLHLEPDSSCEVSNVHYQIGLVLTLQQDYEAAMSTLYYCRQLREKFLGSKHMDLARTIDAIGKVYWFLGELDNAMACHEQALAMKLKLVNELDSSVITSMMNIASVHQARESYDEAIIVYSAVLTAQKQKHLKCKNGAKGALFKKEVGATLQIIAELHSLNSNERESPMAVKEAILCSEQTGSS